MTILKGLPEDRLRMKAYLHPGQLTGINTEFIPRIYTFTTSQRKKKVVSNTESELGG
jgi:hypothetical protein